MNNVKIAKRTFIFLIFTILFVAPVSAGTLAEGSRAPGFTLKSLQGEVVSLEDFKGRLVLLKIATTWCPSCKLLSNEIESIGEYLRDRDVVVLEVFVQDSPEMISKYLADGHYPMTFHALIDDGQVYRGYSIYLIPRFLVVDAEQVVRFDSGSRHVSADEMKELVEEFGKGPGVSPI